MCEEKMMFETDNEMIQMFETDNEMIQEIVEMWVRNGGTPNTFKYYSERMYLAIEKRFKDELAKEL